MLPYRHSVLGILPERDAFLASKLLITALYTGDWSSRSGRSEPCSAAALLTQSGDYTHNPLNERMAIYRQLQLAYAHRAAFARITARTLLWPAAERPKRRDGVQSSTE